MSAQRRSDEEEKKAVAPARGSQSAAKEGGGRRSDVGEVQPSRIALRTASLRSSYRDTVAEMKKINWPDQQTTRNLTVLVIGISVFLGIVLGGIDYLLTQLLKLF